MKPSSIIACAFALTTATWSFAATAQQTTTDTQAQGKAQTQPKKKANGATSTTTSTKTKSGGGTTTTTTTTKAKQAPQTEESPLPPAINEPLGYPTHPEEVPKSETLENPQKEKQREREDKEAAEAVGTTTTTAAEALINAERSVERATDKPGRYDVVSLEWNPLGLLLGGRISAQIEWAPITHHAIVVNPYYVHTESDVAIAPDVTVRQTFTGGGGELGYRYYTGHRGMNGVFIGPSVIGGGYSGALPNGSQAFWNFGLAADVGLQTILADHVVLGAGVGVEWLYVSHDFRDLPTAPYEIATTGVKPRFLLSIGGAL